MQLVEFRRAFVAPFVASFSASSSRHALYAESDRLSPRQRLRNRPRNNASHLRASSCNYTVVIIIPTGVGTAIGGYAGDGLPTARLLSQVADRIITHPNVLNGALMYWPLENALYVEGAALDGFAAGNLGLHVPVPLTNKNRSCVRCGTK